jgi:para-nitrobenzyl esterase
MNRRTFAKMSGMTAAAVMIDGCSSDPMVVETASGKVRGIADGKSIAFRGIRYGASTAGANRYVPAKKPESWTGVQDAFEFGQESPQPHPHTEIPEIRATIPDHPVGEDCLRLNVWTPVTTGKRPVMVWFHGGGFASGNGGYTIYQGASMAARHDLVMVTVNHRLNSFGFLDLYAFGGGVNVGMTDCVAALEWVRDNIERFGGDPANVTIFGQSGGGGKVSTLLAMPSAKGLFHKAIVQSGSYLRGVPKADAQATTEKFLAAVNAKTLEDLQKLPMEQLIAATQATQGLRLTPAIDGTILPGDPFNESAPAISADVPLLTGNTETEVTFFPATGLEPIDATELLKRAKVAVPGATDAQLKELIDVYRKGRPQAPEIDLALALESDARFGQVVLHQAQLKSAQAAPVYRYYFKWRTPVREGKLKSLHCLEIPFVTSNVDNAKSMTGELPERYQLETKMSEAWAAFARTGDPSPAGVPKWSKFDAAARTTMVIDQNWELVNDPHGPEREALAKLKKA